MILKKDDVIARRNIYKPIELSNDHFKNHHKKYELKEQLIGKFFLYEKLISSDNSDTYVISYPKLGLFIDTYLVDMAIEVEWIDVRRNWEYKLEYEYEYNGQTFTTLACEDRSEIQNIVIWHDQLYIYGSWDIKPTYKELKQAYEKTLWYGKTKEERRDLNIGRILK